VLPHDILVHKWTDKRFGFSIIPIDLKI